MIISLTVWHVVVCGQGVVHEASVSDASSDAVPLSVLKAFTDTVPKSEDSSSCTGKAENDDKKFVSVSVKVEPGLRGISSCSTPAQNDATSSSVNVQNSATKDEIVDLKIKDEEPGGSKAARITENQQPAAEAVVGNSTDDAETVVETTRPSSTGTASDRLQPDLPPAANELEKARSKTDTDSLIETDGCKAVASSACVVNVDSKQQAGDSNADNAASRSVSEAGCQQASCEKNCRNVTTSADSEHGDQEQNVESSTDLTVTTQSKCSSPQKSKKLVSKQGKATPPESPGLSLLELVLTVHWTFYVHWCP